MFEIDVDTVLWSCWSDLQRGRKEPVGTAELYWAASDVIFIHLRDAWVCTKGDQLHEHFGDRLVNWYDEILTLLYPVCRVQVWWLQGNQKWLISEGDAAINLAMALATVMFQRRYAEQLDDVLTKAYVADWLARTGQQPAPETSDQMSLFAQP